MQPMMTPEQIQEKVKTIIQLPALPSLAFEVVEMVDDPKTSAAQLGRLISTDQALTGKVLKIANSPFYGFPKKISTIDFAIIVLGFDALKEIVISIALVSSLQKKADNYFDTKAFWDHSISTGVLARRLARDIGYRVTGEVFVAGLLHDMGISILNKYFNPEFHRIVDIHREMRLPFLEAEESVLGVTHAEIGAWLGERWNLPDQLVQTIRYHHAPDKAEENQKLVSIVHCADVFARQLATEPVEYDLETNFNETALDTLRLNDENLIQEYLYQYADALKVDMKESMTMSNMTGM